MGAGSIAPKNGPAVWQKSLRQKKNPKSPSCGLALVSNVCLNFNQLFETDPKAEETGHVAEDTVSLR